MKKKKITLAVILPLVFCLVAAGTALVAKLGIKILSSEDLKSRRISCRLNLAK